MASGVVVILFFFMPESSPSTILLKRATRMRKATGNAHLRSQSELDASNRPTATSQLAVLGSAFILTFSEPIVFVMDLYTALLYVSCPGLHLGHQLIALCYNKSYGILFIWFESFPFVFGEIYHFSLGAQSLVFLAIFVGGIVTLPLYLLWIKYRLIPLFVQPNFQPEMILPPTFFGSTTLPLCLFFYGWTGRESIHWIVPVIGSSFFTVSIITLFNPVLNYLGIAYPKQSASIFAGNALFRASFGAAFPLFVSLNIATILWDPYMEFH